LLAEGEDERGAVMNCEHDWQKREPGREETDADIFNVGCIEWVCSRCDKYEIRYTNMQRTEKAND